MASETFAHISLFSEASTEKQLTCLVEYVLEEGGMAYASNKAHFEYRLEKYAAKAGITRATARLQIQKQAREVLERRLDNLLGG